jgi:hypothetical protein
MQRSKQEQLLTQLAHLLLLEKKYDDNDTHDEEVRRTGWENGRLSFFKEWMYFVLTVGN